MSKTKTTENKPVSEIDKKVEEYRKRSENLNNVKNARDRAYQVFVEHGLTASEAHGVIRSLQRRIGNIQCSAIVK